MEKVTLGGKEYELKPVTLGQLRVIGIGSAKMQRVAKTEDEREANWYEGTYEMLAAAIGMKVADLEALVGVKVPELIEANRAVLLMNGMITEKTGNSQEGEAKGATG